MRLLQLKYLILLIVLGLCFISACKDDSKSIEPDNQTEESDDNSSDNDEDTTVVDVLDTTMIYIPTEYESMNYSDTASTWCWDRSRQSDHFIVFWGKEYGENDPNSDDVEETYRVDIDYLLDVAENAYNEYVDVLGFAVVGQGESNLDKYKMEIYLFYTTDWTSYGSGYDNVIGAIWQSPGTMQPAGSTIAHEIGHAFQYQVYCDLGGSTGYRYGYGSTNGNTFWEQTAQWQSYQLYPTEAFTSANFSVYCSNCFRHICHEWQRYASYFIHYYWADKHGDDIIGKIWRNAEEPEDPIQTYRRITGITDEELNDEVYDAATKFVTWDLDAIRENGADYIGDQIFKADKLDDGSYQVTYDYCPGTTGYNVIPLNVPDAGIIVSVDFTGMVNADGYNTVDDESRAGWRYGYVALLEDGTRKYGEMNKRTTNTVSFTIPENCSKLWFVVTGAPTTYAIHEWDEDESNDDQWPYKVSFTNTALLGDVDFDGTETPEDLTLSYDVSFDPDDTNYSGTTVTLETADLVKIANAFVMQYSEIEDRMEDEILFYGVNSDGSLYSGSTANGYGHWFDANGDVCNWGTDSYLYSEYDTSTFTFTIGQYPAHCSSGDKYTIRQALVYEYEEGSFVQVTFVFNVTIN